MQSSIIPIPRASENWISGLLTVGILETTENGLRVTDNGKVLPPTKAKQD